MAGTPTFYAEGSVPYRDDPRRVIEMKILGATIDFGTITGTVVDYATGGNFSGSGSPEGAVSASPGATYVDTDAPTQFYYKASGVGTNTGWV